PHGVRIAAVKAGRLKIKVVPARGFLVRASAFLMGRQLPVGRGLVVRKSLVAAVILAALAGAAFADGSGDPAAVRSEDGKYYDKDGNPTYKVQADGTVDWYTYSGYRRYHSECHVCHGPDGEGSTYAPALKNSLNTLSYSDFLGIVAGGRQNVSTAPEHGM